MLTRIKRYQLKKPHRPRAKRADGRKAHCSPRDMFKQGIIANEDEERPTGYYDQAIRAWRRHSADLAQANVEFRCRAQKEFAVTDFPSAQSG